MHELITALVALNLVLGFIILAWMLLSLWKIKG